MTNPYPATDTPIHRNSSTLIAPRRRPLAAGLAKLRHFTGQSITWTSQIAVSAVILAILLFIILNFYVFSSIVNLESFFYIFLILSLLTDGLFIALHLPRRKTNHQNLTFDPAKLTILISCYNGEDVITRTIQEAATHVPLDQIIVASDASTDQTAQVARRLGVRVLQYTRNRNKGFNISRAMMHVQTSYVLVLDDDTFIGQTFIPTSLLDQGYTAVAFNVMPTAKKTLVNELQRMEYRTSMELGKNLRGGAGAIGNVSGAIGLFHTKDLQDQALIHSGQFAGEDIQRTTLAHMYGTGKGITYTDSLVLTDPPSSWLQLYRQRAYSWSLAIPELFTLYWRVLLSPRYHHLLKAEKAYQLYIYLTDPLRMLFFWALVLMPSHFAVTYAFYLALNLIIWMRTGFKDTLRAVLFSPIYTIILTICRFIGHFYWLKIKTQYLFQGLHRLVPGRKLLAEYALVFAVLGLSWYVSLTHFANDLQLFNAVHTNRLEETAKQFNYDSETPGRAVTPIPALPTAPYIEVPQDQGDTNRAIAHKAIERYLADHREISLSDSRRLEQDTLLATQLPALTDYQPGAVIRIDKALIAQTLSSEN